MKKALPPKRPAPTRNHPVRLSCLIVLLLVAVLGFMRLHVPPAQAANAPIDVYHVSAADFSAKVLQSPIPVVLQFDADWCPYCRKVQPLVRQFAADRVGKIAIYKVNVDQEKGLAHLLGVQSLPTFILIKNGMEAARLEGAPNKIRFYAWAAQ